MILSDFEELLRQSQATAAFKGDARAFAEHRPAARITLGRHAPRVKVLRVLSQLLAAEPGLAIDRVSVDALSGCSDFRGVLVVHDAEDVARTFEFVWDCQWRALQEGWTDAFGLPDQIRAARAFEWRCFALWHERTPIPATAGRG